MPERVDDLGAALAANERKLFNVCFHILGNRADAEDALQDTLCAAIEAFRGFAGSAKLSTWLYRIAIRSALRVRTKRTCRRNFPRAETPQDDASADPAQVAAERDMQAVAQRELANMPHEQQAVLSLSLVGGLSHAEIADVLGCAEGTVSSRLHRARAELGRRMSQHR